MEDKAIKDFDRHIEGMMNEHSVAPPFGAWNRIAAELDATTVAAPVATPRAPLFNTGTILGFVSGALMIGTMVTGWFVYNNYNSNLQTDKGLTTGIKVEQITNTTNGKAVNGSMDETPVVSTVEEPQSLSLAKVSTKAKDSSFKKSMVKVAAPEVEASTVKLATDKEKEAGEAYYFPPVDIDMPESKTAANNAVTVVKEEQKIELPKIEVKKSSGSSERVKFKKRKPAKWNYGRLNRTRSKSKY